MDDKGYAFTPLAFLLFIPIIILAVSFGDITNELNGLSAIAIGGDVTYTTANNIFVAIEKGAADSGRNSAYNATRKVIDERVFFTDSRSYIKTNVLNNMNDYVIASCQKMEVETGRQIYINNISITNSTYQTFYPNDVTITQEDPFGFYVNIRGGIPIRVEQKDQVFESVTPPTKVYVSIEGLEDPYVWLNTKNRISTVMYKYPYYSRFELSIPNGDPYGFHIGLDTDKKKLHRLWECMNGTGNPSEIYPRPYYFVDTHGLSFFDRLENKTNNTSGSAPATKMSTFILGDPLNEDHKNTNTSRLDHEYFDNIAGTPIMIGNGQGVPMLEADASGPNGPIFYLSTAYKILLNLNNGPYNNPMP